MKPLIFCWLLIFISVGIFVNAQVQFTVLPKDKQFYPRDTSNNGYAILKGKVKKSGTPYVALKLVVYSDGVFTDSAQYTLTYNSSGIANFNYSVRIKAELHLHILEVYGVNKNKSTKLILSTRDLIAGDAYVIQGQSNAEAYLHYGTTEMFNSDFICTYGSAIESGSPHSWYEAIGDGDQTVPGHVGQWGIAMAKHIVDTYQIPVCIINGAQGGRDIDWFVPNRIDTENMNGTNNYKRALTRVQEAGLVGHIKAVFWWQGESDAAEKTDTSVWKTKYRTLYNAWNQDFGGVPNYYIVQIRLGGCTGIDSNHIGGIMEAIRKLYLELPKMHIMSTNGLRQFDGGPNDCGAHFPFQYGYETFAQNIFQLVRRDIYGLTGTLNIEPPSVVSAVLKTPTQLELTFKNLPDTYTWETGSEKDFTIKGAAAKVILGTIQGNKLTLTLSGAVTGATSITYLGHILAETPFVINANGVGMLSIWRFPINNTFKETVNEKFTIYPNPVRNGIVTLMVSTAISGKYTIIISAGNGKYLSNQIFESYKEKQLNVNVSSLPSGSYAIKVINEKQMWAGKFIIQK